MTGTPMKDADLGTLVQHCQLPVMQAGVDAVEARLIVVQELPRKAELRFFTVRDDKRALVSSEEALALLRAHFPKKAVSEMSNIELFAEVTLLRTLALAASVDDAAEPQPPISTESVRFAGLRLRMKVWTDQATQKRYLMPQALMRDTQNGKPTGSAMVAYAMRDDDTKLVELTLDEWNALPFYYFEEDGEAPRAAKRPVDVW